MTLNHPTPSFKVTPFLDAEYLRNGWTYRHSFNEILIHTPYLTVSFRVTLIDSKKFNDRKRRAVSLRQLSSLHYVSCFAFSQVFLFISPVLMRDADGLSLWDASPSKLQNGFNWKFAGWWRSHILVVITPRIPLGGCGFHMSTVVHTASLWQQLFLKQFVGELCRDRQPPISFERPF